MLTKGDVLEIVTQGLQEASVSKLTTEDVLKIRHEHPTTKQAMVLCGPFEWKNTKSNVVENTADGCWKSDCLEAPPFVLGREYQWAVSTGESFSYVWLGVTKSTHNLVLTQYIGDQKDCWGIQGSNGYEDSCGSGRSLGAAFKFGAQSHVILTLDLSEGNEASGTLSISVNGQATIKAITGLRAHLQASSAGYLPAVSCLQASAKILDVYEFY